ncbi:hypothetical protein L207DRAFT_517945 [Hyaloscypha variabilis F]|uniref:Uncharacterized protein n=1 Tax=Hyaloscypha variabilis (strain UAMH 11265 / GT02V1 / F) TaxID=1149755 RepID=A0A2J6R5X2_HYAVF|nr:hypothetical protein L207DRAFT_517945 [Hyaloscypha variabilis F]
MRFMSLMHSSDSGDEFLPIRPHTMGSRHAFSFVQRKTVDESFARFHYSKVLDEIRAKSFSWEIQFRHALTEDLRTLAIRLHKQKTAPMTRRCPDGSNYYFISTREIRPQAFPFKGQHFSSLLKLVPCILLPTIIYKGTTVGLPFDPQSLKLCLNAFVRLVSINSASLMICGHVRWFLPAYLTQMILAVCTILVIFLVAKGARMLSIGRQMINHSISSTRHGIWFVFWLALAVPVLLYVVHLALKNNHLVNEIRKTLPVSTRTHFGTTLVNLPFDTESDSYLYLDRNYCGLPLTIMPWAHFVDYAHNSVMGLDTRIAYICCEEGDFDTDFLAGEGFNPAAIADDDWADFHHFSINATTSISTDAATTCILKPRSTVDLLEFRITELVPSLLFVLLSFLLGTRVTGGGGRKRSKKRSWVQGAADVKPTRRIPKIQNQHLPQVEESQKIKRALRGFANGNSIAGIADTGAAQNFVSLAFAQSLGLDILRCSHRFQLGSSKQISSLGTVQFQWAFSEDSRNKTTINCHVLRTCIYDLILGRKFLAETQTLTKYHHRLSQCVFSAPTPFKFGLLGEMFRRIEGTLGSYEGVLALPDTGAERNAIDFHYAKKLNLVINRSAEARNYLQFADGSCQQTSGANTHLLDFFQRQTHPHHLRSTQELRLKRGHWRTNLVRK